MQTAIVTNAMLDAALAYVRDFDWSVFPVGPDKKPLTPHGFYDATQDEQQIMAWWRRWPDANVAAACGASRIVVIDKDVKSGVDGIAACQKLYEGHEPIITATASTPSGGEHQYFIAPDLCEIGNSASKIAPGVDVRADGGYIVLPPSQTDVRAYEWIRPPEEGIAPLPPWLCTLLIKPERPPTPLPLPVHDDRDLSAYIEAAITSEVETVRHAGNGTRNQGLNEAAFSLGGLIHHGLTEDRITSELLHAAIDAGLPEREARSTIASGIRGGREHPREISEGGRNKGIVITAESTDAVLSERCTEKAAAGVFCKNYGPYVRWIPELGWLVWDNHRWKCDDLLVCQMALEIGQHFRLMAANYKDPKIAAGFFRWAKVCESARGISAFLELAKPALVGSISELDTNPWLLNFRNCRVDLRKPHDCEKHLERDLATKMIPHDYAVDSRRCAWDAFLERILPDSDVRAYIQRAVGYSLTGSTREQCFFLCYGAGCNGKSTFLDVILSVLGSDYAAQADPRTFMLTGQEGIRNDLARLRGIRFLATVETGEGKRLDEALVKSLTGGDAVCARFLHHEYFEYRPAFKLWLATNHRPVIRDTSHAMWRRVRLVEFGVTIPEIERDLSIKDKLLQEAKGILSWAIDGAAAYMEGGLQDPPSVLAATADYRSREDLLGEFLSACTHCWEFGHVGATDLYKAFLDYTGTKISQTAFGRLMEERISSDSLKGVTRGVKDGRKIFKGIGLCATV